jgi:hypothetical protein
MLPGAALERVEEGLRLGRRSEVPRQRVDGTDNNAVVQTKNLTSDATLLARAYNLMSAHDARGQ